MPFLQRLSRLLLARGPKLVDLDQGHIVVPGLSDAHAHIIETGYMMQLPLVGCNSAEEVVQRVKSYVLSHPEVQSNHSEWIEGMGWDQTRWPGEKFPTAADFDREPILRNRLISLSRVDGHAKWVSSSVLEVIGDLPDDVEGGLVVRDRAGKPTGVFLDRAMKLIPAPKWTQEQMGAFFERGLTSIHDADSQLHFIEFYMRRAEEGTLPVRILWLETFEDEGLRPLWKLNLRAIKIFVDGIYFTFNSNMGSWGGAMIEPGIIRIQPSKLKDMVVEFWKNGWQVNIHCVGDRANREVLDIYEHILWRPRIEHAQILTQEDIERMGKLGVIPSVQPTHVTTEMWYAEDRLGERAKGAFPFQSLLRASTVKVLPLGSDMPVESINPLYGFYAAITRLSVDGRSPHGHNGWFSEQRLTRHQALKGMTLDPAYASFSEDELGSITPGKKADFVVLDKDIMTITPLEILHTNVVATVIDGSVVYGKL
ncbi:amidohydrolase 3 [Cyathus striatus]|nr:amidohydrolase 3 [Cyathus striatus]